MVQFAEKLKELRKKAGLSQQQVADRVWVSKTTIWYYEQSENDPSPEMIVKLAKLFHVTTDYLLGLEDKQRYLDVSDLSDEEIDLLQHTINVLKKREPEP